MRGTLNGSQDLRYNDNDAYSIPTGEKVSVDNYQPRVIAKVMRSAYASRIRYFQVRTRSSVNMTAANRHSMALMGGSGALFAALMRDKSSAIYAACLLAYRSTADKGDTFRAFMIRRLRNGLDSKNAQIIIAGFTYIVNPWVSSDDPNVIISQLIIDKFASELSNR